MSNLTKFNILKVKTNIDTKTWTIEDSCVEIKNGDSLMIEFRHKKMTKTLITIVRMKFLFIMKLESYFLIHL
jgi:hypothetical protein